MTTEAQYANARLTALLALLPARCAALRERLVENIHEAGGDVINPDLYTELREIEREATEAWAIRKAMLPALALRVAS